MRFIDSHHGEGVAINCALALLVKYLGFHGSHWWFKVVGFQGLFKVRLDCLGGRNRITKWADMIANQLTCRVVIMIQHSGTFLHFIKCFIHQFPLFTCIPRYGRMSTVPCLKYTWSSDVSWEMRFGGATSTNGWSGMLPSKDLHFSLLMK